ncbi:6-phosphofructokinase [Clostridium saccharobutylicum]|uniref:Pyrophosphate--fructose 6-phosphate 1-phosphotransferase n=1 Tax=Clostridium saccharobutylicum DSM 13864 TaxID=1345695 RepID=U5MZN9_CLOSA|nr:6-phosphofructokinase [Clostridium saccharobutylicum]AGX44967.1 pyrophosphate--fructose 6-phosphate 1-phosphotransferase Pfp [Clostridium saccharobutylicum DSM 13864]AQR92249.1 pyrophosphate--fructose 6-phosphate 1-phosphotransferase [Clostridium saccharobutylicum]AQS02151.1 pyrophosphate--fructose 6-phosphate 1-phosphotransferase [Clostridium saccharobutylicum]AQS11755.1 pyrophosphate--fructose 6-phosphate 1-phosphotransferase [Clostridium saccharobutylicum]AQS16134.1 pyrophosphate--fructo
MSNCIVAQSGGPTSVINSSVVGLLNANKKLKAFDKVYGGLNGIEGILNKNIIDLSSISDEEIDHFRFTPSSGLGSCRYKLSDIDSCSQEYENLINILKEYDITSFFYVGGNDSMDTIAKLSKYARINKIDIKFIGIPKTIDNDLMFTDHTPGFGSAAKFIGTSVLETYLDASVYVNNGIFILETMGRDTGWLAASSCLAKLDNKSVVDFIYLPESAFDKDQFLRDVKQRFEEQNKVYIVVSEGIRDKNGKFISELQCSSQDKFGHAQLGGVGNYLKNLIIESGITSRVKSLELGILQRCAMHCASYTDLTEAFKVGELALIHAAEGETGKMVAINRDSNEPYTVSYSLVDSDKVANHVSYFPSEWINEAGNFVTEEAYSYFKPLIKDLPNLALKGNLPKYKVFNQ